MAIIGLGSQSEFQALAFKAVNGIRRLRVFDIDRAATGKLLSNLAPFSFETTTRRSLLTEPENSRNLFGLLNPPVSQPRRVLEAC